MVDATMNGILPLIDSAASDAEIEARAARAAVHKQHMVIMWRLAILVVLFHNAFQGGREADRAMIANARILGASDWQVTRSVIVPSAMSWIFASLHVSFGFAIIGAIVGEFVGARYGIGLLINIAKGSFDAAGMYAAIIVVMVVALAASYLMTAVENRLARWRP